MPVLVVVGAQWGDEGKGKIIDLLTERADVVARSIDHFHRADPDFGERLAAATTRCVAKGSAAR